MKSVAILGNMNNLGFVWMRYIQELGYKVDLYLFENDCSFGLEHFSPQNDCVAFDEYEENIHQTNIRNGLVSVTTIIEFFRFTFKYRFNPFKLVKAYSEFIKNKNKIVGADFVITMGIGPAFLLRFNRKVDLFFPYGLGVDNVETDLINNSAKSNNVFRRCLGRYAKQSQIKALKISKLNIISDLGLNAAAMEKHGIHYKHDFMPLLYIDQQFELSGYNKSASFSFIHHGRHYWVNDEGYEESVWQSRSKNTNFIVEGFYKFVTLNPDAKVKLKLVEYGKDVRQTKQLISKYGLDNYVEWSGLLNKEELLKYIKSSTVGVGEFYQTPDTHWGCAGWEVLGMGKPLIQGGYFGAANYNKFLERGVLLANSAEEIAINMERLYCDISLLDETSENAEQYFRRYHSTEFFKAVLESS